MRSHTRHTRNLEATKELFLPFIGGSGGAAFTALGGHAGYRINGNDQYIYCELYMPWDFNTLTEAKVVFLALATLTPMNFRTVTDFCQAESLYFQHNNLTRHEVNTVLNRVQECDISSALIDLANRAPLQAKDYLGVQISRQAGQSTNAIFLGVRIRYDTPLYAHAP